MDNKHLFAGSILAADLLDLGNDIQKALDAKVDIIHFDVMDYHFVQNLTFGPDLLKAIRGRFPEAILDVHLMVDPINEKILSDYAKAGASMISFHPEATPHVDRYLSFIREQGCQAGLVFNPGTDISCLDYLWERLDFVLIMTVNPGFGGQKFIPYTLEKIRELRRMSDERGLALDIQVDGGVGLGNVRQVIEAGANVIVAGSAVFKGDAAANTKAFLEIFKEYE